MKWFYFNKSTLVVLGYLLSLLACSDQNHVSPPKSTEAPSNTPAQNAQADPRTPDQAPSAPVSPPPQNTSQHNPEINTDEDLIRSMREEVREWCNTNFPSDRERREFLYSSNIRLIQSIHRLTRLECGQGLDVIQEINTELLLRQNREYTEQEDRAGNRAREVLHQRLLNCPIEAQSFPDHDSEPSVF